MPSIDFQPPSAGSAKVSLWSVRGCSGYLRQIFCILLFFAIGLAVSPPCALLARVTRLPPAAGQRLIRGLFSFWLNLAVRIGIFQIIIPEKERLRQIRGAVLAANHPSLLDAVFLLSVVPRTVCIMRANLVNDLFLGGAARLAGYVPNDSGAALIRHGVEKIAAGENLLIFPEGTRTRAEALNPFKHGFALIAERTGALVQTIFIEREGQYLSKGVPLFGFSPPPYRFHIHLGAALRPEPEETAHAFASRLERYFREHLENTGCDIRLKLPLP